MKLLLGVFASLGMAGNQRPGQCPEKIPNQPNFEAARYFGMWET